MRECASRTSCSPRPIRSLTANNNRWPTRSSSAGKIKAAKDTQQDPDFCVVARVEALIAGWEMEEALKRATMYHEAGADAILIHSKIAEPDEVLDFQNQWQQKCPVVIVPTMYHTTPTSVFREAGFSVVIWANQLLRSAITAMQQTAAKIHKDQSVTEIEGQVVSVKEVFRLQNAAELQSAEKKYLPQESESVAENF